MTTDTFLKVRKILLALQKDVAHLKQLSDEVVKQCENAKSKVPVPFRQRLITHVSIEFLLSSLSMSPATREEMIVAKAGTINLDHFEYASTVLFSLDSSPVEREGFAYADRVDYYVKYLSEQTGILPPTGRKDVFGVFSLLMVKFSADRFLSELEMYVHRIGDLLDIIASFNTEYLDPDRESALKSRWQQLLTENKFPELFLEMIEYFKQEGDRESLTTLLVINQRFNRVNEDRKRDIISAAGYQNELNSITAALLDFIV